MSSVITQGRSLHACGAGSVIHASSVHITITGRPQNSRGDTRRQESFSADTKVENFFPRSRKSCCLILFHRNPERLQNVCHPSRYAE
jgi:hypothetical protein